MAKVDFRTQDGLIVGDGNLLVLNPSGSTNTDAIVFAKEFSTHGQTSLLTTGGLELRGNTIEGTALGAGSGGLDNLDIILKPKGTGAVKVTAGTGGIQDSPISGSTGSFTTLAASSTSTLVGAVTISAAGTDGTITGAASTANTNADDLTVTAGSPPTGGTNNLGTGGDLVLQGGQGKGTADGGSVVFKVAPVNSTDAATLNAYETALTIQDDKKVYFEAATNHQNNNVTNVNSLYVKFIEPVSTNAMQIKMIDNASTALSIVQGSDEFLAFNTNPTDGKRVQVSQNFYPDANNTIDLGSDALEFKDLWVDGLVTSGGGVSLGFGANTKLQVGTAKIDITGNLDISGSLLTDATTPGVTNILAGGYITSGYNWDSSAGTIARMRRSDAIHDNSDADHPMLDVDSANFYTSEILSVTESSAVTKTPNSTFGTNGSSAGNVKILSLNTAGVDLEVYQVAEALACMTVRASNNTITHRVVQKVIGYAFDPNHGDVESTMVFESGDVSHGHFEWVKHTDGFTGTQHSLTLIWKWTKPTDIAANSIVQYSANVHGLSLNGTGG